MSLFPAIKAYLACQGIKYIAPDKAGDLRQDMLRLKQQGQEARQEFISLAKAFQALYPDLTLERASNWMNQAQIVRPHFWNYLKGYGEISEPMFALRLYGQAEDFGLSLEVSFIERKRDEDSLNKQNQVLQLSLARKQPTGVYYFAQKNGESQRVEATEENRLALLEELEAGIVRKVLVKLDVDLSQAQTLEAVLADLQKAMDILVPFYEQTRQV